MDKFLKRYVQQKSQTQKNTLFITPFVKILEQTKLICSDRKTERRLVVAWGLCVGDGEMGRFVCKGAWNV